MTWSSAPTPESGRPTTGRLLLGLVLVLLPHLMCGSVSAQFVIPSFRWPDDAEVLRTDPELRRVGRRLERRFEEIERVGSGSYVLATVHMTHRLYVESARSFATAVVSVFVVERGEDWSWEGTPKGRAALFRSRLDLDLESFELTEAMLSSILRAGPSAWYCLHFDGRYQYHWVSSPRTNSPYTSNLAAPAGSGFPHDPLRTHATPWSGTFPLFEVALGRVMSRERTLARTFFSYAATGKVRPGYEPQIEVDGLGRERVVRLSVDLTDLKLPAIEPQREEPPPAGRKINRYLELEFDPATGLPLMHHQEVTWNGIPKFFQADRFIVDERFGVPFPVRTRSIRMSDSSLDIAPNEAGPNGSAGGRGMTERRSLGFVLHAEFDPPDLADHPALSPDTLADWLGLALEWQNHLGCVVTSIPRGAARNEGVPRIELLHALADRLDSGDLKLDIPDGWRFDPSLPAPVLE